LKTLSQLLGYVSLTGVITEVKKGIPDNLPPAFHRVGQRVIGDSGRYTVVRGTRKVARQAMYGSPARNRELRGLKVKDVKLIHSFESITINPLHLQALRNYDNYDVQALGVQELDRQTAEFRALFDNHRLAAVYSMLSLGHIYYDNEGNLLPSSSGAAIDVDFELSANNQNQLNGIITASWALANTNIPAQIIALRQRAAQLTGYPLKYAFYGANVPTYLTQNSYVLDYLSRNPVMGAKFLETAEIPDGLFGLTWVPVYTSYFEDADGTLRSFFNADSITFTPDITPEVYELLEGSYMVPTTFDAAANLVSALNSLKTVWGMGSYAVPEHNPLSATQFAFDTFLPTWRVPDAIFVADTTP
jgi:hypothetical protein